MNRFFLVVLVVIIAQFSLQNCAKRGRPTGGPKDTIPPVVISMYPADKSLNFKSDKIKIQFDEYVMFKDLANQLIVSPPLKALPQITPMSASKEFTLSLNDTLKPNTTYTFDFGNSIVDNNEGNKLERFKYVFSTGNYLDSLTLSGTVANALERKTDKNISVLLYEVNKAFNDSIIYRKKPNYITSTLDSTSFSFSNLKAGTYLMVALKEKNSNYIFDPKTDKIGFKNQFITLPTDSIINIKIHKEHVKFNAKAPIEFKKGQLIFGFEGDRNSMEVKLLSKAPSTFKSHISFDKKKDSLYFWHSPTDLDSLKFEISNENYKKEYTVKIGRAKKDSLRLSGVGTGMLHLRDQFKINASIPIDIIDETKIQLFEKDTIKAKFKAFISDNKEDVIIDFDKKQFLGYKVKVYPKAITDILGNSNKDTLNYQFITGQSDNYGNLTVQLNAKYPTYFAELITENGQLVEKVFLNDTDKLDFKNLLPGKYIIRFIDDKNINKQWDTGNYLQKKQAENVFYFPKIIEVRANWDIIESFSLH